MTNHLITHERIKTTHIKAKALSIFAENVMSIARKARNSNIQPNNQYAIKLRGIV
jgi:ribosomal protein L17